MYKREYDALLSKGAIPKSVMFYGESDYLVNLYAEKSAIKCAPKEEHKKIYFSEFDFDFCKNSLSTSSLFGDKNIIIFKTDKKIPKDQANTLLALCEKNDESYFFVEFYGEPADAKTVSGYFTKDKKADFVRFFEPTKEEALDILLQAAKDMGVEPKKELLYEIYRAQDGNLAFAIGDIQKLSIVRDRDGIDASELLFSLSVKKQDELFYELFEKKDVKDGFVKIMQEGANEVELLNALLNFFQKIVPFRLCAKAEGAAPSAVEFFGFNPPKHIYDRISNIALRIDDRAMRRILETLLKAQLELKTNTSANKESLFFACLIRLKAFLK